MSLYVFVSSTVGPATLVILPGIISSIRNLLGYHKAITFFLALVRLGTSLSYKNVELARVISQRNNSTLFQLFQVLKTQRPVYNFQ